MSSHISTVYLNLYKAFIYSFVFVSLFVRLQFKSFV